MNNKKGISPLIATVLLLVLTVVIGAIIMTYVRTYTQQGLEQTTDITAKEQTCSFDTQLNFVKVGDYTQVCAGDDGAGNLQVRGLFTNDGSIELKGYKARVTTDEGIKLEEISESITKGSGAKYTSNWSATVVNSTMVKKLEIIPEIQLPGKKDLVYCLNGKIETTQVLPCSEIKLN